MEFFNNLTQQLKALWTRLTGRQRVALISTASVALLGLLALTLWANQVDYQPLFSKLEPEQASAIVEELKTRKEQYQVSDGGTSILVPASRVSELRLSVAGSGKLGDGLVGFEIFDQTRLGTTSFVEKLNFVRAVQGELQRTINSLEPVERSRVHVVLPEGSIFSRNERQASASVVVKLKPGRKLDSGAVQSIVNLVSASIEKLAPERVTVLDTTGRLLASPRDESASGLSTRLLETQSTVEKEMEGRIQRFLETVLGPGKVIAKVQATLDMQSVETTSESYLPDRRVARSEQKREEIRRNVAGDAEGIPGTASNLPSNAPAVPAAGAVTTTTTTKAVGAIEKKESTTNYEIDKTTSRTVQAPGRLSRLTVAVLVDGEYKKTASTAKGTTTTKTEYVPRSAEEMKALEKSVKNAIGFSDERGDELTVTNLPFHQLEEDVEAMPESFAWQEIARYALTFLGMLLVFFLVKPLFRTVAEAVQPPKPDPVPVSALEEPEKAGPERLEAGNHETPRLLAAANPDRQRRDEISNLARSDVDNTVQTIRDWLRAA